MNEVGMIIGIVAVVGCIVAGVVLCLKKKKKAAAHSEVQPWETADVAQAEDLQQPFLSTEAPVATPTEDAPAFAPTAPETVSLQSEEKDGTPIEQDTIAEAESSESEATPQTEKADPEPLDIAEIIEHNTTETEAEDPQDLAYRVGKSGRRYTKEELEELIKE